MKALILFSGGVDSTTCLAMAVDKYGSDNVVALSVGYGQKHSKELEAAERIAAHYGVTLRRLDLAAIFEGSDCSLLSSSSQKIPQSAASIALSNDCGVIYYGAHSDDAAGNAYPDCSSDFNEAINRAIYVGSSCELKVVAPFIGMTKAQVVAKGLSLNAPYKYTWSCYVGADKPCGMCGTCRDRAAAFAANGAADPALTIEENV